MGSAASHPQIHADRDIHYASERKGQGETPSDFKSLHLHFTGQRSLHGYANLKQGQKTHNIIMYPKG